MNIEKRINMAHNNTVSCQNCGYEVAESNCLISQGKTLCEDCCMDAGQRIKV
ncbi:MAG: hypothetical protein MUO26_08295 [Methanotrichaceae archaeon]|nr:hypothetical protein [Methanotrichaceae archaeon]